MHVAARVRHLLARRPWIYWMLVLALAAGAGLATAGAVAGIDEARRAWGQTREVVVATTDLAPGEPLAGRTERQPRPVPMVPPRSLFDAPVDGVARQHIASGEILVEADVAARSGPVALTPPGWRGVPVAEAVPTGAAIGDRVAAASGGVVLAAEGIVVGRSDAAVIVAVPEAEAAAVAHAGALGDVVLLLVP